ALMLMSASSKAIDCSLNSPTKAHTSPALTPRRCKSPIQAWAAATSDAASIWLQPSMTAVVPAFSASWRSSASTREISVRTTTRPRLNVLGSVLARQHVGAVHGNEESELHPSSRAGQDLMYLCALRRT